MKRTKESDKTKEYFRRRRAQFRPWLKAMGFDGLLEELPRPLAKVMLSFKSPYPSLQFDDPPSWWPDLRASIELLWHKATYQPFQDGVELPAIQGVTVYTMLTFGLQWILENPINQHLAEKYGPAPAYQSDVMIRATQTLGRIVANQMGWVARMDSLLIRIQVENVPQEGRHDRVQWHMTATPAQESRALIDGKQRPIFRVASPISPQEVKWIDLDASIVDPSQKSGKLPVFIQSHALERLHERMRHWPGNIRGLTWVFGHLQVALANAMENPRLAERSGEDLLFEFHFGKYKTGYLVAKVVGGKVLIRTFLLCGMEGTPEGAQLKKRLKLGRDQIEWLYLDHFAQWMTTDLCHDARIRPLLEECGLGDLLRCATEEGIKHCTGLAETFVKFVGEDQLKRARNYFRLKETEPALENGALLDVPQAV